MPSTLSMKNGICQLAPNPAQRLVFAQLLETAIKGNDDELTTTQLAARCVLSEEESRKAISALIDRGLITVLDHGGEPVSVENVGSISIKSLNLTLQVEQGRLGIDVQPKVAETMPSVNREELGVDEFEINGNAYRVSVQPQVIDGQPNGWYVLNIGRADGESVVVDKEFDSRDAAWSWADDWREPIDFRFWLARLPLDEPKPGHVVDITYLEPETMDALIHDLFSDDSPDAMGEGENDEIAIGDRTYVRSDSGHRWPGLHLAETCAPEDDAAEITLTREDIGIERFDGVVASVLRVDQGDSDFYNVVIVGEGPDADILHEQQCPTLEAAWEAVDDWKAAGGPNPGNAALTAANSANSAAVVVDSEIQVGPVDAKTPSPAEFERRDRYEINGVTYVVEIYPLVAGQPRVHGELKSETDSPICDTFESEDAAWEAIEAWYFKASNGLQPIMLIVPTEGNKSVKATILPHYMEGLHRIEFPASGRKSKAWHKDVAATRIPDSFFRARVPDTDSAAVVELVQLILGKHHD